jgi:hypothetical protein
LNKAWSEAEAESAREKVQTFINGGWQVNEEEQGEVTTLNILDLEGISPLGALIMGHFADQGEPIT